MKNKKFVTALLHACTFYCVSAQNVPWQYIAGNEYQEYFGRITGDLASNTYVTGCHRYPAAFAGFAFPQVPDYFHICPIQVDIPQPLLPCLDYVLDICSEGNSVWIKYCFTNGP